MPCYHPLSAQRGADGSIKIGGQSAGNKFSDVDNKWLYLPCGSCVGCIKSRARDWAIRCSLELQYHDAACWATLTYDDANVPLSLDKSHLALFMRRLRKRMPKASVRFFASGEYGEKFGRPHYHPILYGVEDEKVIQDSWARENGKPFGFAKMHTVSMAGIAYVAGYVQKKFVFREEVEERIDYSTGEVYTYQPPFIQMSRNPGIGGRAKEFTASWRNNAMYQGRKVSVPRFLHDAWKKNARWRDVVEKALELQEYHKDNPIDWERLDAGEKIDTAALDISSRRRMANENAL